MDAPPSKNPKLRSRRGRNRKIAAAPPNDLGENRSENSSRRRRQKKIPTKPKKSLDKRPKRSSPPTKHVCEALPLHERAKYVALDCEMVGIGDGHKSAVARVCLLDWDGGVLLDTFVRVTEPVADYRTFVSGIRREHLSSDDAVDFEECRSTVRSLLEGKILVGHALKNDLRALDLSHPWHDVRDTAKYEPFMKTRFDDGVLWPRKLKELAEEKLGQEIQQDGMEHSPIEDAKAALDLYKLVRKKWEKVMEYKIKRTREIRMQKESAGSMQRPKISQASLPVQ